MNYTKSFWFTSEQAAAQFYDNVPQLPKDLLLLKMENWVAILTALQQQRDAGVCNADLDAGDLRGRAIDLPNLIDELKHSLSKKDLGQNLAPI